jgi:hypothetical protein
LLTFHLHDFVVSKTQPPKRKPRNAPGKGAIPGYFQSYLRRTA